MKIYHIRNATMVLELGAQRLLVDPMLGDRGQLPSFKMVGAERHRNPTVALPEGAWAELEGCTGVLLTHEHHVDHLDEQARQWILARGLPVWCSPFDLPRLKRYGFDARLLEDGALGMRAAQIEATHGRGLFGWLMGPGVGFYLEHPDEPSVYLTGDTVLTQAVKDTIKTLRPEVVIAPAGAANFGIGPDILFSVSELVELTMLAQQQGAKVVFNHLESLDHCPTTRAALRELMSARGLDAGVFVPEDGERLTLDRQRAEPSPALALPKVQALGQPGLRKRVAARLANAP